ncbi:MAG TPA: SAM-dependent methyltransferase [Planctomycetota bacterium]|nr:SAM-dependent methyltransferase [Planctomycetota bacterium]
MSSYPMGEPALGPSQRMYLTSDVARALLAARRHRENKVIVSLDLNRTRSVVHITPTSVRLPDGADLALKKLQSLLRKGLRVFLVDKGDTAPVERRGQFYYYKLMATESAPTLEISGVKMHRTEGCCPYAQAEAIVRTVVRAGDRVLDSCGGLGYTAIWAARLGAERVVSIEHDLDVLEMARLNPWSEDYFFDSRIDVIPEDVTAYLGGQPSGSFDAVVHDPPHISRAGELYGRDFYFELSRVLTATGKLYHYVGEPHSRRGQRGIHEGVAERLTNVRFEPTYVKELTGFVCTKRR